MATVNPLLDRMTVLTVDEKERARIMALIYVIVITFTSPFGWVGGVLSEMNRIFPFILNISFFALGGVLTFLAARHSSNVTLPLEVIPVAHLESVD